MYIWCFVHKCDVGNQSLQYTQIKYSKVGEILCSAVNENDFYIDAGWNFNDWEVAGTILRNVVMCFSLNLLFSAASVLSFL